MGWGTAFKDYAIHPENIFNQACSGASSKSYKICDSIPELCYKNHNWDNTKQLIYDTDIGEGAYLLIQFAHNDEKKDDPVKATFPGRGNSFYTELKVFTDEARVMGLIPVLITPVEHMEKNIGEDLKQSHIKSSGDFAQTVRDLATDEDVLLLDLQNKSWNEFNKYRDTTAIMQDFAFDDVSHFSPNGAKIVAGWVKELACASIDKELCAQFK
jgi:lysophospholipase L1-like esterase